jgi:hypothetical protein
MVSGESTRGNWAMEEASSALERLLEMRARASAPVLFRDRKGNLVCIVSRARRRYASAALTRGRYGKPLISSIMS